MLLYADDVLVMRESVQELQSLQDVAGGHGKDFVLRFSRKKSETTLSNRPEDESDTTWTPNRNYPKQTAHKKST